MRRSHRRSSGNLRQQLRNTHSLQKLPPCGMRFQQRRASLPSISNSLADSGSTQWSSRQRWLLHSGMNSSVDHLHRERHEELTNSARPRSGMCADKASGLSEEGWASAVLAELAAPPSRSDSCSRLPRPRNVNPPKTWQQRLKLTNHSLESEAQDLLDRTEVAAWQALGRQSLADLLPSRLKQTFKFFGTYEVPREHLKDMLIHLGFHAVEDSTVEREIGRISKFSTFNFDEIVQLADNYAAWELANFRDAFEKATSMTSGKLYQQDIADVMTSCGMIPQRRVIVHALTQRNLKHLDGLEFSHFIQIMSVYRVQEGFTCNQIKDIHDVFHGLAEVSSIGTPRLKSTQLVTALLQAFGIHCADQAKQLVQRYPKYESDTYVLFRDFLVIARRLHEMETRTLYGQFKMLDQNNDGRIGINDVAAGLQKCGYTLLHAVVRELVEDTGYSFDRQFNFDDYVDIVQATRHREGFRKSELEELVTVFNRFDSNGSDSIDGLELRKIFRHLGHAVSLRQVHSYVRSVDANEDGVLNFEELLRFIRVHRERELKAARNAFEQTKARRSGDMHSSDLNSALVMLGQKPTNTILESILESVGKPFTFTFDGFIDVLDKCRRACADESRRRAEWSDKEFEFICQRFGKFSVEADGGITKGQLLWVLMDLGVKICTSEDRDHYLGRLDEARASARIAGVREEDVGLPGSSTMTVWVLAHLFRLLAQKDEEEEEDREVLAREETGFSHMEVAEFSEIFLGMIEQESGNGAEGPHSPKESAIGVRIHSLPSLESPDQARHPAGRPQSRPSIQDSATPLARKRFDEDSPILRALLHKPAQNPQVSLPSLRQLLASFGLHLSLQQYQELKSKALDITAWSSTANGRMDFADFLRLMKWLLDTNFADINGRAQQVADESTKTLRRPRVAVLAVKSALYWKRIRRPTVY